MKTILKGSSLAEFGMLAGLVSVMSIGAVLGTGQQASQIFCETRTSIASSLGKDVEPCAPIGPDQVASVPDASEELGFPPGGMVMEFIGTTVNLQIYPGPEGATIYWSGSESTPVSSTGSYSFTYPDEGPHMVVVDGTVNRFVSLSDNLSDMVSFGEVGLTSLQESFAGDLLVASVPAELPETVVNLYGAFRGAGSGGANPAGVETWDTSGVSNMQFTFYNNSAFDRDISGWDVSAVTGSSMYGMFGGSNFGTRTNGDISDWCVSHIPSEPEHFGHSVGGKSPLWGYCTAPTPNNDGSALLLTVNGDNLDLGLEPQSQTLVFFGDGSVQSLSSSGDIQAISYDYDAPGTYTVQVEGNLNRFQIQNGAESDIVSIDDWGTGTSINTLSSAFKDAGNLASVPGDLPSTVASMAFAFQGSASGAPNPTGVETWDTSNVTNMQYAFSDNTAFNRDISGWDVSNVSAYNMSRMFWASDFATRSNGDISDWCVTHITSEPDYFGHSVAGKSPLWGFCGPQTPSNDGSALVLTVNGDNLDLELEPQSPTLVFFGDGSVQSLSSSGGIQAISHDYDAPGTYTVQVEGNLSRFQIQNGAESDIVSIDDWGTGTSINSLNYAFRDAVNLASVPGDLPSTVASLFYAFQGSASGAPNPTGVETWDTSNVTNMQYAFSNNTVFNRDISGWDVSNVSAYNMSRMFWASDFATRSNGDISDWCVTHITSEPSNFGHSVSGKSPLWGFCGPQTPSNDGSALVLTVNGDNLDLGIQTQSPALVFFGDGSVQSLSSGGGIQAISHDYDAPGTYTVQVEGNLGVFQIQNGAESDIVSIDDWGTGTSISALASAFKDAGNLASVPGDLPSTVTSLSRAFQGSVSGAPNPTGVETWDTGNVNNMQYAFQNNTAFNRDISGWDVSGITNDSRMIYMFQGSDFASRSNGDISDWCVSHISSEPDYFGHSVSGKSPLWGFCGPQTPSNDGSALVLTVNGDNLDLGIQTQSPTLVFFGDGSVQSLSSGGGIQAISHDYDAPGTYTVQVEGNLNWFQIQNGAESDVVSIDDWGTGTSINTLSGAFRNAGNLASVPGDLPSTVTVLSSAFYGSASSSPNPAGVETWNTGNVVNMLHTFRDNTVFNRDISGWDVSNVSGNNMRYMFRDSDFATRSNGDISDWCVSHISSEPSNFDHSVVGKSPLWGAACAP